MAGKSAKKKPKAKRKTPQKRSPKKKAQGTCFALMPFKEPFDTYYKTIIRPVAEAVGLEPIRADSLFRPTPIMDDLWKMIQNAKVVVAELTERNPNVFYELGLAHAIGKPVVLLSNSMDDVPFDLQSYRVVTYDKDNPTWGATLKREIKESLTETLADPVEAVPPMFQKQVKSQAPEESEVKIKLRLLEREVRALKSGSGSPGIRSRSRILSVLRAQLLGGEVPPSDAVRFIVAALRAGLEEKSAEAELRDVGVNKNSAARIMREARMRTLSLYMSNRET